MEHSIFTFSFAEELHIKFLLDPQHFVTHLQTVRFKNELERNITIKLGYANAKIYKCEEERCPRPMCYKWVTIQQIQLYLYLASNMSLICCNVHVGLMEVGKKIILSVMCWDMKTAG